MRLRSATAEYERNSHTHPPRNELQVAEVDPAAARRAIARMPRPGAATPQCRLHFRQCHRDRELDESIPGVPRATDSLKGSRRLCREVLADNRSDCPPSRATPPAEAGLRSWPRETDVCRDKRAHRSRADSREKFRDPRVR